LRFGAQFHCSELPDKKVSSAEANAFLPVENRTRRSNSRDQHQQKHQREPQRQRKQNARHIERRFPPRHSPRGRQWNCVRNVNNLRRRAHEAKLPPLVTRPTRHGDLPQIVWWNSSKLPLPFYFRRNLRTRRKNPHLAFPLSRKRDRGVDPRAVHSQNSEKRLPRPQADTGFRHAAFCHR
jgi:hypothetical protein